MHLAVCHKQEARLRLLLLYAHKSRRATRAMVVQRGPLQSGGGALGAVRPRAKAIVAIMAGSCTCPQLRGGAMSRNLHEHLEVSDPAPIRLALEHPVVLVKVEEPLGEVGVDALPQLAQSLPGVYLEEDARARYARTGLCLWRGRWTLVHTLCLS